MTVRKKKSNTANQRSPGSQNKKLSSPRVSRAMRKSPKWNDDDDHRLKVLRSRGLRWQDLEEAGEFLDKTSNACRKRHERLVEIEKLEQSRNGVSFTDISQAYIDTRKEMWALVAQKVGNVKWELVEKLAFEYGVLTLTKLSRKQQHKPKRGADHANTTYEAEPPTPSTTDDEEDVKHCQEDDYPSRDSSPHQHTPPVSSQQYQDIRAMYYTHQQPLPVLPEPLPCSGPTRQVPQQPHHPNYPYSHFQQLPPFTLPAVQPHTYGPALLPRPVAPGTEYNIALRYAEAPIADPYQRNAIPQPAYHDQVTPATRHEELSGERMSVQSILSGPSDIRQPYA